MTHKSLFSRCFRPCREIGASIHHPKAIVASFPRDCLPDDPCTDLLLRLVATSPFCSSSSDFHALAISLPLSPDNEATRNTVLVLHPLFTHIRQGIRRPRRPFLDKSLRPSKCCISRASPFLSAALRRIPSSRYVPYPLLLPFQPTLILLIGTLRQRSFPRPFGWNPCS